MGIDHLLGDQTPGPPVPRLTPRAPLSVKELTGLLIFLGLVGAAYDKMSTFAKTTAVEKVVDEQFRQQLANQHNFDVLTAKVDQIIKTQAAPVVVTVPVPKHKP
jgi:vacuolar-type H+-ATPase subunit F/Vma7